MFVRRVPGRHLEICEICLFSGLKCEKDKTDNLRGCVSLLLRVDYCAHLAVQVTGIPYTTQKTWTRTHQKRTPFTACGPKTLFFYSSISSEYKRSHSGVQKILMSPFKSGKIVHRLYVRRRCWRKLAVPQKKIFTGKGTILLLTALPFHISISCFDLLQYAPAVHSRMKFQQERNNVTRFLKIYDENFFCPFPPDLPSFLRASSNVMLLFQVSRITFYDV